MAVLELNQIKEIIKKPKASSFLGDAEVSQDVHKLHINGEGFEKTLGKVHGYESEDHNKIKEEYAKPTTKRIFSQILNQFRKAFRAQGFSRNYRFRNNDKTLMMDFGVYLRDVASGLSMEEVMQMVWFPSVFTEFNGVFIVEMPEEEVEDLAEPFIKFIPLKNVHDIHINGQKIEYIVFEYDHVIEQNGFKRNVKKYRVIDDAFDYYFIKDGDNIEIAKNEDGDNDIIPNFWGYVPCVQPSTKFATLDTDVIKTSHISQVMPNADLYLSISNSHTVSVKLHQHPLFYSFPVTCPTCNGAGVNRDEDQALVDCHECNGEGNVPFYKKDTSRGITIPEPDEGNSTNKAEAPCGYVSPDIESIRDQREELRFEENNIEKGALGVEGILLNKTKRETATGKEIDFQPLLDLLNGFSKNGEYVEKFLTDAIGYARYGDRYLGSDIGWGRRYFVRTEQMIEFEYGEAKRNGLPVSTLKELLEELIYTKFENNPKSLRRSLMLLELEPFPTYTQKELEDMQIGTENDRIIKLYFNDFIEEFERKYTNIELYMAENGDPNSTIKFIKDELQTMAEEKKIIEKVEEMKPIDKIEIKDLVELNEAVATGALKSENAIAFLKLHGFEEQTAKELINVEI